MHSDLLELDVFTHTKSMSMLIGKINSVEIVTLPNMDIMFFFANNSDSDSDVPIHHIDSNVFCNLLIA